MSNLARAAIRLLPAPRRFVYARSHMRRATRDRAPLPRPSERPRSAARPPPRLPGDAPALGQLHADPRPAPHDRLHEGSTSPCERLRTSRPAALPSVPDLDRGMTGVQDPLRRAAPRRSRLTTAPLAGCEVHGRVILQAVLAAREWPGRREAPWAARASRLAWFLLPPPIEACVRFSRPPATFALMPVGDKGR